MAIRKFLTSVADVYGYDNSDTLLFIGKTLLDSSIEVSLGSAPVRGGRGNQLLYIYYHTGEMKITLTDAQWNLGYLGATVGSAISTSTNVYQEESVNCIVTGDAVTATITKGPALVYAGLSTIYGWATTPDGNIIAGTFAVGGLNWSGTKLSTDSLATGSNNLCIRYYALNAAAEYIQINANMIPKIVKLVMETQLNSADVTTNKIGVVQIIVPTATLSGAFTISMKSDGVSNTPLTASALAYNGEPGTDACAAYPYYARIIEIIDSANWYDNVVGLSVVGGDFNLTNTQGTTLNVYAVPATGAAFKAPLGGELDFAKTSGNSGLAIDVSTGVITSTTVTGTAVLTVHVHDVTATDSTVMVTVV
jgi:hypothetical protein